LVAVSSLKSAQRNRLNSANKLQCIHKGAYNINVLVRN
jgi:hypothetical protein